MPKHQCNIAIVYNAHNKKDQFNFISKLLPALKKRGYRRVAVEISHKDLLDEFKQFADLNKQSVSYKELEKMLDDSKKKTNADRMNEFKAVTSFRSAKFSALLNVLNANAVAAGMGHINIGEVRLNFPANVEHFIRLDLDKESERELVKKLKGQANKMLDMGGLSNAFVMFIVKAMNGGFTVSGIDVADECMQSDSNCRDKFMANKLLEHCANGKVFATVGLSHTGIADILKVNDNVIVKELYSTDFKDSDSPVHNALAYGNNKPHIQVIDSRESDATKIAMDYIGAVSHENGEL